MDRKILRNAIIVLGLIVAVIHLVILNVMYFNRNGIPNVMFTFNGLAFLILLGGLTLDVKSLSSKEVQKWLHYVFVALALATVIGFFIVPNETAPAGLGYFSVAVEVLLMIVAFMHMQQVLTAPPVVEDEAEVVEAETEDEAEAEEEETAEEEEMSAVEGAVEVES